MHNLERTCTIRVWPHTTCARSSLRSEQRLASWRAAAAFNNQADRSQGRVQSRSTSAIACLGSFAASSLVTATRSAMMAFAMVLGSGGLAFAQAASAVSAATAADEASLIRQAIELRRVGQHESAVLLLRRAYELRRSPRACGQLALGEQAIGRWASAERYLREALAAGEDEWVARNRATLEVALTAAARRLATVEIVGGDDGAELWVDGERARRLPTNRTLRVVVGTVRIEHRPAGGATVARVIELAPGQRERVYFAPQPGVDAANVARIEAPRATPLVAAQRRSRAASGAALRAHPTLWAGAAVFAGGALAGALAWGAGQSIAGSYDAQCFAHAMPDRVACEQRRQGDQQTLDTLAMVTDLAWTVLAAGGVTAGVGVGLTITGRGATVHGRF